MKLFRSVATILSVFALASCEKNAVQDIAGPVPGSKIRFFNFGVNAPQLNFYANDTKVTAISSTTGTESVLGVAYGAVSAGGFYSAITPNTYTLTGKIAAATDKDLTVSSVQSALADGASYSYYVSGFYNTTTKTVEAFVVEDNYPATIDFTTSTVRFVNAISNSQPMILYAKNTVTGVETAVGGAVAYKAAGTFTPLPGNVYDLTVRLVGGTTNLISRTAVSFSLGKVYTITARGDITVTSTTATNRPILDNTANR